MPGLREAVGGVSTYQARINTAEVVLSAVASVVAGVQHEPRGKERPSSPPGSMRLTTASTSRSPVFMRPAALGGLVILRGAWRVTLRPILKHPVTPLGGRRPFRFTLLQWELHRQNSEACSHTETRVSK